MTLFFICAALLVLLIVGWILLGLFRSQNTETDQEAVNISLARERRATLEAALADGAIDQATFEYERQQLEYDLAADLQLENKTVTRKGGHLPAAIIVAAFIPIAAGAMYLHLGNPAAITQAANQPMQSVASAEQGAPSLVDLLPQVEQRVAEQPDDIEGWRILGRTYLTIGEFAKAKNALEKALALDDTDVATMAQLAEAIGMTQQGNLAGEPLAILTKATSLDSENDHALWLLSIAKQQAGDHQAAMEGFNTLAGKSEGNPEALGMINEMRARSQQALAGQAPSGSDAATPSANEATGSNGSSEAEAQSAEIIVTVDLSEDARSASDDSQAVFIYATATQGPPMPLAVSRMTVADLPVTVTLDNSMAMIPTMTLSSFDSVTVGARVSKTGNAIAQPGDWFTEVTDIEPATTDSVSLTVNQQTP